MKNSKIYELLYYLDPVVSVKGTLMGFLTKKQFADLMQDPKYWAIKIGSGAFYTVEDLSKHLKAHKNVRLVVRFEDPNDKFIRKLFITDEITDGTPYNIDTATKGLYLTDESFCHLQVI